MEEVRGSVLEDKLKTEWNISAADREILRGLAGKVAALAARYIEAEKKQLWTKHNDLVPVRPLIFCDPENGWNEIILPEHLKCTNGLARAWEYHLRREIFWGESMKDDRVIEPYFPISCIYSRTNWGLYETNIGGHDGGARTWESPIKTEEDLDKLSFSVITPDRNATDILLALANGIFGDLLTPRIRTMWYWTTGLTWEAIKLRGLEQFMVDMYDNPKLLHRLMAFLRDGTLNIIEYLERENLFTLNNEGDYVGSGGFGWTSELPAADFNGRVRAKDLWVLSESQETVGISPAMFEEFIFPYQLPIAERVGLTCYGCCEGLHSRWEAVRKIPNLRRVSVSPWCDREKMTEYLGDRYIYSLKPHPTLLASPTFDAELIRKDVRDALEKTRGCHLEIIMKDNHTIQQDPARVVEWVRIVREEIENKRDI